MDLESRVLRSKSECFRVGGGGGRDVKRTGGGNRKGEGGMRS